jgi:hypothetical protein
LVIRPDDIHLALQLIFCTTIELNAEKLRSFFVDFEGKKNLEIRLVEFDSNLMFRLFKEEIRSNIKEPEFADKYLSNYSTTTPIITNASSGLLMNALKEYFTYTMVLSCGIPEVVLEGTDADWNRLNEFYLYMKTILSQNKITELDIWFEYFDQIMNMFDELNKIAKTNTNPTDSDFFDLTNTHIAKLWSRVITYTPYGSGGDQLLGGWIRLFFPYDTSKKVVISSKPAKLEKSTTSDKQPNSTKSNFMDLDLDPQKVDDFYASQEILAKFYMASSEDTIPDSFSKTKLEIIENEKCHKSEFVSGFFEPHIDNLNMVRFNIGTIVRHDAEIVQDEKKEYYISLGVKYRNSGGLLIPYYLESDAMQISKIFETNCWSYYQTEKCLAKAKSDKTVYESFGIQISPDNKTIYVPRKFAHVYHYKYRKSADEPLSEAFVRPAKCTSFALDKCNIMRAYNIKASEYSIKFAELDDPSYVADEYDIEFDRNLYKSVSTTVFNSHSTKIKNMIKSELDAKFVNLIN